MENYLDKIMKRLGFKIVLYPVGNPKDKNFMEWYTKSKIPYGTAISKSNLMNIITEYERS